MNKSQSLSGRWVLAIFFVSISFWAVMAFGTLAHLRQIASGLEPFDVRPFGYSVDEARNLLDALSEPGRTFYSRVQLWLDTFYPATYAISRSLILLWLTKRGRLASVATPPWLRAALLILPIMVAFFDYAENVLIGRMIAKGSGIDSEVIVLASRMTELKSLTTFVTETVMVVLGLVVLLRWWRGSDR
jgi:hypothetical protein